MDITSISVASRVTVQRQRIAQRRHNVEVVCEGVIHQSSDTAGVFGRLLSSVGNVSVSTMSRGACEHTIARVGGMPPTKFGAPGGWLNSQFTCRTGDKNSFYLSEGVPPTCRKGSPAARYSVYTDRARPCAECRGIACRHRVPDDVIGMYSASDKCSKRPWLRSYILFKGAGGSAVFLVNLNLPQHVHQVSTGLARWPDFRTDG
jgi:hypothetical protein